MNAGEELSSNDEAPGDEDSAKTRLSLSEESVRELVSSLLLSSNAHSHISVVEYLTKICVLCEADNVADRASVKTLAKHMYLSLTPQLQVREVAQEAPARARALVRDVLRPRQRGQGPDQVARLTRRAVDEYANPYDWLYANVVDKHLKAGRKLDSKLELIDVGAAHPQRLQRRLVDALQAPHSDQPAGPRAEPAAQPASSV